MIKILGGEFVGKAKELNRLKSAGCESWAPRPAKVSLNEMREKDDKGWAWNTRSLWNLSCASPQNNDHRPDSVGEIPTQSVNSRLSRGNPDSVETNRFSPTQSVFSRLSRDSPTQSGIPNYSNLLPNWTVCNCTKIQVMKIALGELLWRNAKPKSYVLSSLLFPLYPLTITPEPRSIV